VDFCSRDDPKKDRIIKSNGTAGSNKRGKECAVPRRVQSRALRSARPSLKHTRTKNSTYVLFMMKTMV